MKERDDELEAESQDTEIRVTTTQIDDLRRSIDMHGLCLRGLQTLLPGTVAAQSATRAIEASWKGIIARLGPFL